MNRHRARPWVVAVVVAGLSVHIGLGYRFGLVIAGVGAAAHLVLAFLAHRVARRRTADG
ncbi:hypothetical protein ACQPZF_16790 [Actinosynnema sp. CS-041913]|uniref:hypothetical protein n=1 Tax=Actinosynnema sp. CS-041913 TaxID=3239917 RepID=UPI003D910995